MLGTYHTFNPDGTYGYAYLYIGQYTKGGGEFTRATGNWHITVKGTVHFTNLVSNTTYADGTKELNEKQKNFSYKYYLVKYNCKEVLSWHDPEPVTSYYFEKLKK